MMKPDRLQALKEAAHERLAMTVASVQTARSNQ